MFVDIADQHRTTYLLCKDGCQCIFKINKNDFMSMCLGNVKHVMVCRSDSSHCSFVYVLI